MSRLLKALEEYADSDYLPMHMPGHKRRMGDMGNPFFVDITEIEGFDNLHHAEGRLLEAQMRAASLYHSQETHYLVNGSTAGILSAISGCTDFGKKILIARNSHRSAYHAVLLRGLQVQYIYPQSTGIMGINGAIMPEDVDNALSCDPDIQAVFVTSPTYDGVVSDIPGICEAAHRHGVPLIVDGAHGAHFSFSEYFPDDPIRCGADIVIHSLHKTLPALTQTALLHVNGPLADRERIRRFLAVYQTSSPSYVLMAAIDECIEWVRTHKDAFDLFAVRLEKLRGALRGMKALSLLEIPDMDPSKILVSAQNVGLDGYKLNAIFRRDFHIEMEMACRAYICAVTTVADTKEVFDRFLEAMQETDRRLHALFPRQYQAESAHKFDEVLPVRSICTILEAENMEKENCPLEKCSGHVSGNFVMLYPPGVPLLAPGEEISAAAAERLIQYIKEGVEVHGINGMALQVLKNRDKTFHS